MDDLLSPGAEVSLLDWKKVLRYAYSLVGNMAEAEDITQDAFVVLFKETQSGRPVQQIGAWMKTVTRRLAYRSFSEHRPELNIPLDAVNEQGNRIALDPVDPAVSVEKVLIDDDLLRLSAKVVCEFPEKDRECIMMYFRGYDFVQIATALKVSRWTARRNTLKALQKLQSRIDRRPK
ncbi:MAG TPA: sigma-70 family RNA polymerase sigma factor [Acidobacteriaceae bacterium]|jgi:RNA polymerase sigma factor (sigma-70 family)|nr:sigma-70 family RNA polymerase sigma factor [Acidobacteriaceae bacterium]